MDQKDYNSVIEKMRLADGNLWPIPINLDVHEKFAESIKIGCSIALRDQEGVVIAVMRITDIWEPNKTIEAESVFGTRNSIHPSVKFLYDQTGPIYLGGPLKGIQGPVHYDFKILRHTPNQLRQQFSKLGWKRIVAFNTSKPLHRVQQEFAINASKKVGANLLLHPVVGFTNHGDLDYFTRIKCYNAVLKNYPKASTKMSLINLATRMAGPREAVWHGLIRKNHGCSHIIIEHNHAEPEIDGFRKPFYGRYKAKTLFMDKQSEIGIEMINFKQMIYVKNRAQYEFKDEINDKDIVNTMDISESDLKRRLNFGLNIPDWFSSPEVIKELRKRFPPRHEQGFTVFFTGLSGSGKSTLANALMAKLLEKTDRPTTLLDGDIIRKTLSSELGFSKEHRDLNIRRLGFVATEITKNGGIAICAPIAPYQLTRMEVRKEIENFGTFIEVHVATSLEECERRDRKGLYKLAREGKIKEFTGVSDPYEIPEKPEIRLETENLEVEDCANQVILKLVNMGLLTK